MTYRVIAIIVKIPIGQAPTTVVVHDASFNTKDAAKKVYDFFFNLRAECIMVKDE